jgi:hypothetical protein
MEMATLQFYQNKYNYPKYTETLTSYGSPMDCTPVGINLHGGTLRVKGTMTDFMSCNYMSLARDGQTLFAWVDDVKYLNENAFEIAYTVDAWRTYKGKIDLGVQFIRRSPVLTYLQDNLLGSTQDNPDISTVNYTIGDTSHRIAVVQVRASAGETFSNVPVQPSNYQFYLVEYPINSWQDCAPLSQLMSALPANAQTRNIVTIYSVPWFATSSLPTQPLNVEDTTGTVLATINGFKCVGPSNDISGILWNQTRIDNSNADAIQQVKHTIQVVIPEAGILSIPDEIYQHDNVYLRQDIDIFSGACNYMLTTGNNEWYSQSVRGSSMTSIPILSNPEDTYISQNQNGLATSLIGDVANVALGVGLMAATRNPTLAAAGMSHGMDLGMMGWGAQTALSGGTGLMENWSQRADGGHNYVNPPAFLGTALASNFNGQFWVVTTQTHVDNDTLVHSTFGYPFNKVDTLTFPAAGYIETQNCDVASTDGSVPRWALKEINTLFDNGILVK